MSRHDSFFESAPDSELQKRLMKSARAELALNRRAHLQTRWLQWGFPALASVLAFFIFLNFYNSINEKSPPEITASNIQINEEQQDLLGHLLEDEEALELLDAMTLLEELEYLEDESDGTDA